jgi:hypothetical protein
VPNRLGALSKPDPTGYNRTVNPISPLRRLGRARPRPVYAAAAGVLVALASLELGLGPLARQVDYPPGAAHAYVDSEVDRPMAEFRQYREGISVADAWPDGARMTGNPPIDGAPCGVILGDSHIRALPVDDRDTAASVLERTSRAAGAPLNVREYGFSGAAGPTYAAIAPEILRDLNPAWIAVVLDPGDLGGAPLLSTPNWRMTIGDDDSVELVRVPPRQKSRLRQVAESWIVRSTLARLIARRTGEIVNQSPQSADSEGATAAAPTADEARVPLATVRLLARAYGDRLLIVYTPYLPIAGDPADEFEQSLLDACVREHVTCVSTRAAMLDARDRRGRFARGFVNTAPDEGHLNAEGHRIVADAIWSAVAARSTGGV